MTTYASVRPHGEPHRIARLGVLLALGLVLGAAAHADAYDPLAVDGRALPAPQDLAFEDEARDRELPLRVYLPATDAPAPVVLFSHGLGGSREGSAYLGRHWAARGYAAVFLQHPGSDETVWRDAPPGRRVQALRDAADLGSFRARVRDVSTVLDRLAAWNGTEGHPLAGRLDLSRVGMSGHSFGALTTQALAGQRYGRLWARSFADSRIDAAVIMSPSSPRRGSPEKAFAEVALPWLLLTGTRDVAAIGGIDVESRLAVFPALPPGGKYELVLDGAEHSAFTDRALPGDTQPRNPNHHRAILATSSAFWDATLREDAAARVWLDGAGPRSVLEEGDRWRRK